MDLILIKVNIHFIINIWYNYMVYGIDFPNIPIRLPMAVASSWHYVE